MMLMVSFHFYEIQAIIFIGLWIVFHKSEKRPLTSSGAKRVELSLKDFVIPTPLPKSSPSTQKPHRQPTKPQPKEVVQKPVPKPVKPKQKSTQKPVSKPKQPSKPHSQLQKPQSKPQKQEAQPPKSTTKQTPQKEKMVSSTVPKSSKVPEGTPKETPQTKEQASPFSELAEALGAPAMQQPSTLQPPSIEEINQAFSDQTFYALYKDEFDHFTPNQKEFIKNNFSRIQGITQHYLTVRGYPYFAGQMGQQGVNVVEFYLLPNGDITDLKIIKPTGFEQLDQNSIDTIKAAYKDYPRPKEKTKIRFYIHYIIR